MKKSILALLAVLLAMTTMLSGCGGTFSEATDHSKVSGTTGTEDAVAPSETAEPTPAPTEDFIMQDGSFDGLALMSDVERAFCEAAGKTLYFEEFDTGGEWELHVYTEEGGEEVEWYHIDEQGVITDSAGEIVTLDDFRVRDDVLAGLRGNVSSADSLDLEWETNTWTITDYDGYVVDYTVSYSPFMVYDNTMLAEYWNEVNSADSLPEEKDLHDSLIGTNPGAAKDIYCAVGTISAKNVTNGWDFTAEEPYTGIFSLNLRHPYHGNVYSRCESKYGFPAYCLDMLPCVRIFYSNGYKDIYGGTDEGLVVNPKMQSNQWGPISFIMVLPEEFSPNYPSGQFRPAYEEECYLTSGAWPLNRIMFNGAEIVDDSANLPIKFID